MIWLLLGTLLPSFAIASLSGFVVRRIAKRLDFVDMPGVRKVHQNAIPLGGGIAIWLGIMLPFALGHVLLDGVTSSDGAAFVQVGSFQIQLPSTISVHLDGIIEQLPELWFLLGAGTLMMILGLCDDIVGVGWRIRLACQVLVAVVVVVWQGWQLTIFFDAPLFTAAISVVWIVWLINSFNMLDNMDGLSAGIAGIACGLLAAVLLTTPEPNSATPQLFVGGFLLVLVGALAGFLCHNLPPAKMFMGDAGSYLVGFCVAILTILATFAGDDVPRHAILAPLCVLAVPLYDTLSVLYIRLRTGKSPFEGDQNHFSHRLVQLGMNKRQAVWTIYLATATCGLGALLLRQVDAGGAIVVLVMIAGVLCLIAILESVARRKTGQ